VAAVISDPKPALVLSHGLSQLAVRIVSQPSETLSHGFGV